MRWTEERRKLAGINLTTISESTMSPKLRITIDGVSTTISLTREHIEDMRWQSNSEEIINNMIDEEIEKHPNFIKTIRKTKLEQISEVLKNNKIDEQNIHNK